MASIGDDQFKTNSKGSFLIIRRWAFRWFQTARFNARISDPNKGAYWATKLNSPTKQQRPLKILSRHVEKQEACRVNRDLHYNNVKRWTIILNLDVLLWNFHTIDNHKSLMIGQSHWLSKARIKSFDCLICPLTLVFKFSNLHVCDSLNRSESYELNQTAFLKRLLSNKSLPLEKANFLQLNRTR